MADDINGYLTSVFTREDVSSLPVPYTKFEGPSSDYLGQVTSHTVAKKITTIKDNKSPGLDGIQRKILMETIEPISIPLAKVVPG